MSDLIERQALLDAITASINQFGGRYTTDQLNMWGLFSQMITELPPAQLGTNLAEVGTDCISRQALLDKFEPWLKVKDYNDGELNMLKAVLYEIRFMRPAQPEQTGCDYCHEDIDGYVKPIEKNGHAFVRFGMNGWELSLKAKGWHGEAKIQYCPMCGRKL